MTDPAYEALDQTVREMVAARRQRDEARERLAAIEAWAAPVCAFLRDESIIGHHEVATRASKLLAAWPGSVAPGFDRAPGEPWPGKERAE